MVDVAGELRQAVITLLDEGLARALEHSAAFTSLARLPKSDAWDDVPIRFGMVRKNGLKHQLDWSGGTLTLVTHFELGIRLSAAERVTARAEAEIVVSPDGFTIRRLAFTDDVSSVLSEFAETLTRKWGLEQVLGDSVALVPVFEGNKLSLELRGRFRHRRVYRRDWDSVVSRPQRY